MRLENDKIDQIEMNEVVNKYNVEELYKLNRGVTSIIVWVAKSIGKWILKEGLGALTDIVLGKKGDPMIQIMQSVENLINQRLTQFKKLELEAEYIGFIDSINRLQDAINLVEKYENDKTSRGIEELVKAKDVIKYQLSALDILFTQRLPQFEIKEYEGISLPLFAPITTLHLTLLKDAVLNGEKWGLDASSIKYYQKSFNRLVPEYTKRAINLYDAECKKRNAEGKFIFKNAMKETLNLIYLWSLYQYEGINPTFSQSYWYTGGIVPSGDNKSWEYIYRLANGPTNEHIKDIKYFITNRSIMGDDDFLHGMHPLYNNLNKYTQRTGLLGSPGGRSHYGGGHFGKENASISDFNKTKKWWVTVGGSVVIYNGKGGYAPSTSAHYENHFVRTFSFIPYNVYSIPQFSIGDTLEHHDLNNTRSRGNVVLGFAPNNTKSFFEKGKHLIPKDVSYTIPALQFYDIQSVNNAFLKEYLEQGTDGGLEIKGNNKDETCIHYRISLENINTNQEYKTLLRFGGIGTVRIFIELDENNRIQVGEIKTTNLYDWKDYIIEGPLPKHFKNKKEVSLVIDVGASDINFSQAILIPKNKFKVLIP